MKKLLGALIAAVVVSGTVVSANLVVSAEFREVVIESALIVRGVVTDVRSVDVPGRSIDSILTLSVESVVKGEPARFVYVRLPGGEIGRKRFVMVGAPTFKVGDRAVFFLKRASDGAWRPVGLSQGVYRVRLDRQTGRATVPAPVLRRVTAPASGRVARGDPRRQSMSVGEFEALVALVNERRTARRRGGQR